MKREVTRVVTPGTLTDDALLDPRESNYLAAIVVEAEGKSRMAGCPDSGALFAEGDSARRSGSLGSSFRPGGFMRRSFPIAETADQLAQHAKPSSA